MTLPREVVFELMAFADGELEGAARERAESLVASNAEARGFVEATRSPHLRAFLETQIEGRAAAAGADAVAESVMKALAAEPTVATDPRLPTDEPPPSRAAPLAGTVGTALRLQARVPRPALASPQVRTSLGIATFGVALAMAAGVALYVTRHPQSDEVAPVAKVELAPAKPGAEVPAADGVEVDEIDSPAHDISVFEINGNAAAAANPAHPPSVVIWVEDGTSSGSK
jgi:hypothetical protein